MKTLILTQGLPRSGKSTWARAQGYPIVSPDAIRLSLTGKRFYSPAEPTVWATAYLMVDALFAAGHMAVIVDACNISAKRVEEWTSRYFPLRDGVNVEAKQFPARVSECKERAIATGMPELVDVIDRMAAECDLYPKPILAEPEPFPETVGG